ncbi:MAG: NRDE family protein [Casimicrobiaceae bacterium]
MCLAVIALQAHRHFALVVAANRDEFHARAATPATWGAAPPWRGILAGRDAQAGGTWLGVHRDGRFALVTNVRGGGAKLQGQRSRGELVPRVLAVAEDPALVLSTLRTTAADYAGVNVLAGSSTGAAWWSTRGNVVGSIAPGVAGLSNAALDTPWPKVQRATAAMRAWAARGTTDLEPLFAMLADRTPVPDGALPTTGVPLEWERLLATPFIVDPRYGTRCTTVLAIDHGGHAVFHERTFAPAGIATGEVVHSFDVQRAGSAAVA